MEIRAGRVFAELCKSTEYNDVLSSEGGGEREGVEAVGSVVTFVTRREPEFLFVSRHVCSASIFYIPLAPNFIYSFEKSRHTFGEIKIIRRFDTSLSLSLYRII